MGIPWHSKAGGGGKGKNSKAYPVAITGTTHRKKIGEKRVFGDSDRKMVGLQKNGRKATAKLAVRRFRC